MRRRTEIRVRAKGREEPISTCDAEQVAELYARHSSDISAAWSRAPFAIVVDTPKEVFVFGMQPDFFEWLGRRDQELLSGVEAELVEHVLWCWRRHREIGSPPMPLFVVVSDGAGHWRSSVAHGVVMQRGGQA